MTATFPRESIEFLPVTVTVDGAPVTTGVTFAVTVPPARPTVFNAPTIVGARIGILITGYTPGTYVVWAKVVGASETPVINCGEFRIN